MIATPRQTFLLVALAVILGLAGWWTIAVGPLRDPQAAMLDFYAPDGRAEDQLAVNGQKVVPLVIADVKNKEMRLRRYAIGFLGNGRYAEALSILLSILNDDTELFYFRADALIAIYQISPAKGKELAPRYVEGEELLGRVARRIVGGTNDISFLERRSWWKAFLSVHE